MSDEMTTLLDRATPSAVDALDYEGLARRGRRRRRAKRVTGGVVGVVGVVGLAGLVRLSCRPTRHQTSPWRPRLARRSAPPTCGTDVSTSPPLASEPANFERYVHPDEWAAVIQDCAAQGDVTMVASGNGDLTSYDADGDAKDHEVIEDCRTRFPVADGVPPPDEAATIVEPVEPVGDPIIVLNAVAVPQPDVDRWAVSQDWATEMIDCLADSGIEATSGDGANAVRMEGQQGGMAALDACQDGLDSSCTADEHPPSRRVGSRHRARRDGRLPARRRFRRTTPAWCSPRRCPPVDEDGLAVLERAVQDCAEPSDG